MKTEHWGLPPSDIDNPIWQPLMVKPTGVVVTYQEKYGGLIKVECIGVWYDKVGQKYRLTYRDSKAIELQTCNLDSIEWEEKK